MSYRGIACGQGGSQGWLLNSRGRSTPAAVRDETPRGWGVGQRRETVVKECKHKRDVGLG